MGYNYNKSTQTKKQMFGVKMVPALNVGREKQGPSSLKAAPSLRSAIFMLVIIKTRLESGCGFCQFSKL